MSNLIPNGFIDGSGFRTGLLKGKKATVIMSRGWSYRDGSPLSICDLQEPWIRMILVSWE